jgi:hypothetical protein
MNRRVKVTLFWTFTLLACFPVWWSSTSVYRADVSSVLQFRQPSDEVQALVVPLILKKPIEVGIDVVVTAKYLDKLRGQLQKESLLAIPNKYNFKATPNVSPLTLEVPWKKVATNSFSTLTCCKSAEELDDWFLQHATNATFTLFVVERDGSLKHPRLHLGKHKHFWLEIPPNQASKRVCSRKA